MNEPATEVKPDALDAEISKRFPQASEEVRAGIKARALKRGQRMQAQAAHRQMPIVARIAACQTIEQLGVMRAALILGLRTKQLDPDPKTLGRWEETLWARLCVLIATAKRPGECCFIYNFVKGWEKMPHIEAIVEAVFKKRVQELPNDAEWLLSQGIEIEGVTKLPRFAEGGPINPQQTYFVGEPST